MKVLQVCAYAAPFEGNFIKSLKALEMQLNSAGYDVIYAFPETAVHFEWYQNLKKDHIVYSLPLSKARIKFQTYEAFRKIYRNHPDIVIAHSHFELYDLPMTLMAPQQIRVFWHLHDAIEFETIKRGLRGLIWKFQYGVMGKRAILISVSKNYMDEVIKFGFPTDQMIHLANGIDLERISKVIESNKPYDFLMFGWDFFGKGGDILIEVGNKLYNEGYRFHILYNGNITTWNTMDNYLSGRECPFIVRVEPTDDVNELYANCKVLISASRAETFSYAIAEAVYAGLPVISSDIPGVAWAKEISTVDFFQINQKDSLYTLMKNCLDGRIVSVEAIELSREKIREKYSVTKWAADMVNIYHSFLPKDVLVSMKGKDTHG